MAHYIRYEIYLPVRYKDPVGNLISIEVNEIQDFLDSIAESYEGYTQSNPLLAPPLRGFWRGEADEISFIIVLVPSHLLDTSLTELTRWKEELENRYNQKFILVMYHAVQIIGEL